MRLFVAIKTDKAVNAAVKNAAASLSLFGSGSFCGEDMYHITLAFIGETDKYKDAINALSKIKHNAFEITTNALGCFGNTYYVSVSQSKSLTLLQEKVVNALASVGIETEKRSFKPHITVARRYKADMTPFVFVPMASMQVDEIMLMESKNGNYLPLYTHKLSF